MSWHGNATKAPLYKRARLGMRFVTEERSVFMKLTTADNLSVAGVPVADAVELFPELEPLLGRVAGLLSGGEQQMLTLARAVAAKPALLLPTSCRSASPPHRQAPPRRRAAAPRPSSRLGVLLVEQHVRLALGIADRVYVMQRGHIVMDGTVDEVRGHIDEVESTYLPAADGTQGQASS